MNKKQFIFSIVLGLCPTISLASQRTAGADFLRIPVGAEPASLGGAYSALAADAYAPTWNPGGLGFVPDRQLAAEYTAYVEATRYQHVGYVHPFKGGRAFGAAIQYLTVGDIIGTDATGTRTGDFSSYYGAYSLSYGQAIGPRLSLGITGKLIDAKIDNVGANAPAVDFGGLYKATEKLTLGATYKNLGKSLRFLSESDSLPRALHVGGVYQFKQVRLALEGVHPSAGKNSGHAGIEWRPANELALRAGYRTDTTDGLSSAAGLTMGLGLFMFGQSFSYAWLPMDELGNTHHFSFMLRFK